MSAAADLRVVVLAAGRGSRLGALGEDTPKWLLEVGGRTIADRQLAAVDRVRRELSDVMAGVTVITGHAADAIESFLSTWESPALRTLHNPHYAEINNWYSVLLALREVPGHGDPRVVIVNGDLCADPSWIASFLIDSATTTEESLIGVDFGRNLTDESMKVSVEGERPALLREIGKLGVERPAGEYVGLLMARGDVLRAFRETLERFVGDPDHVDEWYERSVGITAAGGTRWSAWPTPDSRWVEIDDDRDLELAVEMAVAPA